MASKQAAAGEALAAQINGMSRPEMYDMMSKMKVRPPPAHPNPQTLAALFLFPLLCLFPPTRLFADLFTVLLTFLCYAAIAPRRP
jgi:ABC-type transporter Mla maintaining outer membrane lipid asymmetry permease subunit MlaE